MNKYKISEEKGLNEEDIIKLEHLKIEGKNKRCNFHEEMQNEEDNGTLYCGNCCKRLCEDCYTSIRILMTRILYRIMSLN